jgi:hypothetical protein
MTSLLSHIPRVVLLKRLLLFCLLAMSATGFTQTSDDHFRRPLKDVLIDLQKQYGITIRYPEELVKDRWVTYAGWRLRPDVEETLSNILGSQDIAFTKEGERRYKLQNYQYHLKTPQEGKEQLEYLSGLYSTVTDWEKRKDSLRACLYSALQLSKFPAKLSSKPIVTATRKFNGYTVENIALETAPGVYVCGSLYKPVGVKGKLPVVLNPDGHFSKGRYREDCQYRCAMQAKMGAIAFSYDLFGWDGESQLQVEPKDHRRSLVQSIQVLNTLRILDYLLSLKEVDPGRVAITGASGGGSQTMLVTALDPRIKLSIPVAMLSSYHSGGCPCESGMGVHLCGGGTNNVELAAMAAPRPQLVISDGKDWTQQVPQVEFPFLQRTYGFYGAAGLLENTHLASEGHDYNASKRKAAYAFLAKHFRLKLDHLKDAKGEISESGVTIEGQDALKVFGSKGERLPPSAIKGYEAVVKAFTGSTIL